jgi:hypothetical protein
VTQYAKTESAEVAMSLKPNEQVVFPAEATRLAQAVFPEGNAVIRNKLVVGHDDLDG